jgi:tripartite-type tricarboxylate transporter receptor subunit TctC
VSVTGAIAAGAVKAYAVSSPQRLASLPDVPTANELGVGYAMDIWAGIFAPKDTPAEIVDKLADVLDISLDDPTVQKRLADLGGALPGKDERHPAKFEAFVQAEIARWSPILKAASPAN